MHSQTRPALLTAAVAIASKPQMLFDEDDAGSHRLVGYFVPTGPMADLIRAASDADKVQKELSRR